MGKGEITRAVILERASSLASRVGLAGVTIGRLADDLRLSKSGLFAHFQSKESLQEQLLDFTAARFTERVIRPALREPRGEPRVRALFARWLEWPAVCGLEGGCLWVAVAAELDDQDGPVRDRFVALQKDWMDTIAQVVRTAIAEGHFAADLDAEQFAFELYGLMMATHHAARLLRDPQARVRAWRGFERLVDAARAPRAGLTPS